MAFAYDRLTEITYVAAAAGTVFTNPAAQTTYVRLIVIHNTNATAETVDLWNVPDNAGAVGTASDANKFWQESVAADATTMIEFPVPGLVLESENDTIQAKTTTGSKVTIQIFGGKE